MLGLLAPLLVLAGVAVVVAVAGFFVVRLRAGTAVSLTPRLILIAYLYVMSLSGVITMAIGLSSAVRVALSYTAGRDFSYYRPVPFRPTAVTGGGSQTTGGEVVAPGPTEQDVRRMEAETERQRQQDTIGAVTSVLVGGLLFGTHTVARRRIGPSEPGVHSLLGRAYITILLCVFGLTGVISLIMGIQNLLQWVLLPATDATVYRQPPGESVAAAVVFVPGWLYYLWALVRQSRTEG